MTTTCCIGVTAPVSWSGGAAVPAPEPAAAMKTNAPIAAHLKRRMRASLVRVPTVAANPLTVSAERNGQPGSDWLGGGAMSARRAVRPARGVSAKTAPQALQPGVPALPYTRWSERSLQRAQIGNHVG